MWCGKSGVTYSLAGVEIRSNEATNGRGGGLYVGAGTVGTSNLSLVDNDADKGGGFYLSGGFTTFHFAAFTGNTASTIPGGAQAKANLCAVVQWPPGISQAIEIDPNP